MLKAILKTCVALSGVVGAGCVHVTVGLFVPLTSAFHVSFSQLCQPAAPTAPLSADLFHLGAAVSSTEASVCGAGHPR